MLYRWQQILRCLPKTRRTVVYHLQATPGTSRKAASGAALVSSSHCSIPVQPRQLQSISPTSFRTNPPSLSSTSSIRVRVIQSAQVQTLNCPVVRHSRPFLPLCILHPCPS